ncbi:MAG: alpha/beta hydrolase [Pseudomonadota bacterium]
MPARILKPLLFALALTLSFPLAAHAKIVTIKASDGLPVTAELSRGSNKTAIVLFHQAGSSRGEYQEIAPRLNSLGYTTLAVDQRSGGAFGGIANQTADVAKQQGKGADFLDAKPDLEAAIAFARNLEEIDRVFIWGSSYSASLVLVIAGEKTSQVDAVLSFSPGEYLRGVSVEKLAAGITVPAFLTSARSEAGQWRGIYDAIPDGTGKTGFVPKGNGRHGSSSLIAGRSANSEEFWTAVEAFLKERG